ncbi:MAG: acyl-CoA thioesterase, partial [Acinetobacter sp.]
MSQLTQFPVIYEQKVAWGDMDAFGHVNNVMY